LALSKFSISEPLNRIGIFTNDVFAATSSGAMYISVGRAGVFALSGLLTFGVV
jgi:hypothetical protein